MRTQVDIRMAKSVSRVTQANHMIVSCHSPDQPRTAQANFYKSFTLNAASSCDVSSEAGVCASSSTSNGTWNAPFYMDWTCGPSIPPVVLLRTLRWMFDFLRHCVLEPK